MDRFVGALDVSNQIGIRFLFTEVDMALTFLSVADASLNEETTVRNRENARAAYDSALHYRERVEFTEPERLSFEDKLAEVKRALLAAGFDV